MRNPFEGRCLENTRRLKYELKKNCITKRYKTIQNENEHGFFIENEQRIVPRRKSKNVRFSSWKDHAGEHAKEAEKNENKADLPEWRVVRRKRPRIVEVWKMQKRHRIEEMREKIGTIGRIKW